MTGSSGGERNARDDLLGTGLPIYCATTECAAQRVAADAACNTCQDSHNAN
jgi:hypothetical protein